MNHLNVEKFSWPLLDGDKVECDSISLFFIGKSFSHRFIRYWIGWEEREIDRTFHNRLAKYLLVSRLVWVYRYENRCRERWWQRSLGHSPTDTYCFSSLECFLAVASFVDGFRSEFVFKKNYIFFSSFNRVRIIDNNEKYLRTKEILQVFPIASDNSL